MAPLPESVRCPTCRKPTPWRENPCRPFCSEQCKLRDLGQWATERYRIAGEKVPSGGEGEQDDREGKR